MRKSTWFFIVSSIGAIAFILLPIILHIPFIHDLLREYLSVFSDDYKKIYIETLGALYGVFWGVSGAVWAQGLAQKYSKKAERERNAKTILADLKDSQIRINSMISGLNLNSLPDNLLHVDRSVVSQFEQLVNENRYIILPDWKQLVLSLDQSLKREELALLMFIYTLLLNISNMCDMTSNDSAKKLYLLIRDMKNRFDSSVELKQLMEKLETIK